MALRGQESQEHAVGFGIVAQLVVDQPQRARTGCMASGWKIEPVSLGMREEADEVDRIAREDVAVGDVEAAVVDAEVGLCSRTCRARAPASSGSRSASMPGRGLHLLHSSARAEDAGQVADVLGDQEVVLHEALDGAQAARDRV